MSRPADERLLDRAQQANAAANQLRSVPRDDRGRAESVRERMTTRDTRLERAGYSNLIVELRETIAQLERAMVTRSVIEQAKGIVMATRRCDADAAFDVLRRISQNQNQKLHDVADDLVARTAGRRGYRAPAPQ